jgi:GNAT superfamily N-acetyltransferase
VTIPALVPIGPADADDAFEAWRSVFFAVSPAERAPTVTALRAATTEGRRLLLAHIDGVLVGSGAAQHSDLPDALSVEPRVLPTARRRGVGSALLLALVAHAPVLGLVIVSANVDDQGGLAFAERFGFAEIDRQVEQVRQIGREPPPRMPAGVRLVSVAERPELWSIAYDVLAQQAFEDMATISTMRASLRDWERDWIGDPAATFLALAGDEVIGCAGLIVDDDQPDRAEHGLTTVRRDWRGRGVAAALKRATLHWASQHGLRDVYTWTQRGNDDMRRLNAHLGYQTRTESISVRAHLPLKV